MPPPLCCTCLAPVVLCVVVKPLSCLPLSVSHWGWSIVWERNCVFSLIDSEGLSTPVQDNVASITHFFWQRKAKIEVMMYVPDKVWYITWESVCCHWAWNVWGMFSVFVGKTRSNYTLPQTSLSNFLSGICDAQNVPEQIFSQDNPAMLFNMCSLQLEWLFLSTGLDLTGLDWSRFIVSL